MMGKRRPYENQIFCTGLRYRLGVRSSINGHQPSSTRSSYPATTRSPGEPMMFHRESIC